MNSATRRTIQYIVVLAVVILVTIYANQSENINGVLGNLTSGEALNWLGIIITVFSLSVTFFLAVMAIEAFTHLGKLREVSQQYDEVLRRMKHDEERLEEIGAALSDYNVQFLDHIETFLKSSGLDEKQRISLSEGYLVSRARLELAGLRSAGLLQLEHAMPHVLVLSEFGGKSDLELALNYLAKVNRPRDTYAVTGEIIKKLRTLSSDD